MAFKRSSTSQQLDAIRHLGFLVNVPSKMTKFVRWIPPLHGLMLNVDSASKGNPGPCGGGGIFRDPNGNVSMAFSHYYGAGSSVSAEVRAMHDGVLLAIEKGFALSSICLDSLILVNSLRPVETCGFIPFVLKEDLGSRVLYSSSGEEEKASYDWMWTGVGRVKTKLRAALLLRKHYDKIEKSESMQMEINSGRVQKLIVETLKIVENPKIARGNCCLTVEVMVATLLGALLAIISESRFDLFELCPGVGTVVAAIVACGVPEWWHSFGYGWFLCWYLVVIGVARVVRLGGPLGWAQSAHRFSTCELDRGMRRVLNATTLVVAFLLPVLSALLDQGGSCCGVSWRFEVLVEFSARSRREDVVWSGGNAEGSPVFAFFTKSRFDLFELCPGVGTVVAAIVACSVPEWWHSFGYGWYMYLV
ncbi:hypothetical protein Taro_026749 [Colocasia esculenta]|uniref:RNase H type-1 domain-containing protein n=1 Tax=Colocasia esculenta TaxID=4460 RepID=A0A843VI19_COLES|nr:hypothetical protein [Colocasia esculenta]